MRCVALIFAMMICGAANAELVSRGYVDATVETRVDTSKDAKQVMTGPSAKIGDKYLYEIWPNATNAQVGKMYTDDTGLDDWGAIPAVWK